jgi:hypothetical protein
MLTLSPLTVAPVCHVGDPLQLTCTAHLEFLRWNFLRANEQGTLVDIINSVIINSRDAFRTRATPLNFTTITFMKISTDGALPLVTRLSIDSVNTNLNGTVVRCSDITNPMASASTTIQIIDTSQSELIMIISYRSLHVACHWYYHLTKTKISLCHVQQTWPFLHMFVRG